MNDQKSVHVYYSSGAIEILKCYYRETELQVAWWQWFPTCWNLSYIGFMPLNGDMLPSDSSLNNDALAKVTAARYEITMVSKLKKYCEYNFR